ncbi:uncharacterized protein LOC136080013 [Hydra vulgaris]|uniref:Uncharacterized protein LOC136080013 n=1 Tax=Hydra vulgaris TaxID=6087 RepID=A0ABM4BU72_HYDVU
MHRTWNSSAFNLGWLKKISALTLLVSKCKEVIKALHFKGYMLSNEIETVKDEELFKRITTHVDELIADEENPILDFEIETENVNEINIYLSICDNQSPALLFWKNNAEKFPILASIAKVYLALSCIVYLVPVECLFSTTGLILNGKRSSLALF